MSTTTVSAVRCRRASPGSVYGQSTSERSACGPVASVDDGTTIRPPSGSWVIAHGASVMGAPEPFKSE